MTGLVVRPMCPDDRGYVFSTWLLSSRDTIKGLGWERRRRVLTELLKHATVYVAEAEGVLLGYTVVLGGEQLWAYTQRAARGLGIQREIRKHTMS